MNRAIRLALGLLLYCAAALPTLGTEEPARGTLSVVLENDLFYNVDRHYTNGVGFVWVPDRTVATPAWMRELAELAPWFPATGQLHHGYAFGQSMFTPSGIIDPIPSSTERPYAGWLYGTVGITVDSHRQLDVFALTLGIVGPASLAEQSQKIVHKLVGADEPRGWDTQLHNEPGIVVTYQRSWPGVSEYRLAKLSLDLTPTIGGSLGNVFTYGNVSLMLRLGKSLPHDFGPPRIQPGLLGSGAFAPTGDFTWYAFAGIEGRAVARNIFLDGNSFRNSRRVHRDPLVGDLQWGIVLEWRQCRIGYTHVFRSREYRTQTGGDQFGAISLSVRF